MPRRGGSSSRRGGMKKRRVPKDWTYVDGSYSERTFAITAGPAGVITLPLTISQSARKLLTAGPVEGGLVAGLGTMPFLSSWAGIPEGGMQRVFGVQGTLMIRPNTWNIGNNLRLGWRLLVLDQDSFDLSGYTTPFYSMFVNNLANGFNVATGANEGFLREGYLDIANISGTAVTANAAWQIRFGVRIPRGIRLGDSKALYLYLEAASGSVTLTCLPRLRCLQSAAGNS